jgi:hypothetical protein
MLSLHRLVHRKHWHSFSFRLNFRHIATESQSLEVPMFRNTFAATRQKQFRQFSQPTQRSKNVHKQIFVRFARLLAPSLLALAFANIAHAQGTMDFSGATTLMGTFKTFAVYAGAVICFGGLIFAGIRMMSGRFQDAIPGLFGALFGAGVLGWGAGWIGSLTGQGM